MTTTVAPPAEAAPPGPRSPLGAAMRRPGRLVVVLGILAGWLVLFVVFRGRATLDLAPASLTPVHRWFNDLNDAIGASRNSNPIFLYFFNEIRLVIDNLVTGIQYLISQPVPGRGVPLIGWLGVVAIAGYVSLGVRQRPRRAPRGRRVRVLRPAGTVGGEHGHAGADRRGGAHRAADRHPAGHLGGPVADGCKRLITPVLDLMQTMPTFVYLAPLTLFFLIGPASATIATLIYAMPPAIRITAHAIASVPQSSREAADSLGATGGQTLVKVLLPMAKRTIVVGINQTIMAALAMVTIAALIDAPGLGKTVIKALSTLDVGTAFNAGLAIVVMADRAGPGDHRGRCPGGEAAAPLEPAGRQRPAAPPAADRRWRGRRGLRVPVLHLRVGGGVPRRVEHRPPDLPGHQ